MREPFVKCSYSTIATLMLQAHYLISPCYACLRSEIEPHQIMSHSMLNIRLSYRMTQLEVFSYPALPLDAPAVGVVADPAPPAGEPVLPAPPALDGCAASTRFGSTPEVTHRSTSGPIGSMSFSLSKLKIRPTLTKCTKHVLSSRCALRSQNVSQCCQYRWA